MLFIDPVTVALNDHPELVIAEIRESEPECFIFVIVSSIPLLNHDLFATVVLENHASSMFTMTSINGTSFITLIAKYDLSIMFLSKSYSAGLDFPIV